ncbi:MAG: penicillin acylase family protein [Proteobacteria bacterium]|nr:penicillin acylase family protein [Pseudomonadota bacterium]
MLRWLKRGALALLVLFVLACIGGWWLLRGSVARLDGQLALPGLSAPVTIERDGLGVVTIHAANATDAMRALGFVHAQERYFEMDLMRRSAAGELSELFGPLALDLDKKHRVHRFRARVQANIALIAGDKLPQLRAYTEGVNAGLNDLAVRPWPYLLLGVKPKPWQLADTPLVGYAMYFDLQGGDDQRELALWRIEQHVPPALWALLSRDGTSWDAPLQGLPRGDAVLPDAATLDLRQLPMPDSATAKTLSEKPAVGSGNLAVGGSLTADGRAIVADDMHLGLRAPGTWFRARLLYPDAKAPDGKVDVSGFTLPGIPGVIVGSNTHVAWGFTNSYGDWMDWARDCADPKATACTRSDASVHTFDETILVKGGAPVVLRVTQSDHGVRRPDVAGADAQLSEEWTAHLPGALTLRPMDMATVGDLDAALKVANQAGIPAQNVLLGDRDGHIAWTIGGRIPRAFASMHCDRAVPEIEAPNAPSATPPATAAPASDAADGAPCPTWEGAGTGWLDANPVIRNPPSGRLWTANNRVVDGEDLRVIGDGGYALGARAQQMRDDLFARNRFTEKDLLAIQLDDRALFLQRWWKLLQDESARAKTPALRQLATAAAHWDGRAAPDSVSYRLVRAWRIEVLARIRDGLLAPAEVALGKDFLMPSLPQLEGVAWPLLMQRPDNLLPRRFADCANTHAVMLCHGTTGWDALLEDAAAQVRDELAKRGPLAQRRWGERNTAAICHPLAQALPSIFKRWLCMPPDELPGDTDMPRVAAPDFGASERMVVAPGHEADGIIEMPAGQSGNPLSPFWGAGHEAWVRGEPTPFLPGATKYTLRLMPGR